MSVKAYKIGCMLFCLCGTLLALPEEGNQVVQCEQCMHKEPVSSYEKTIVTTRSAPEAFPSSLRQKRKTQTKRHEQGDRGTLVAEMCPECSHMEAYSKELQLRSADEGSTIFYTCASCKHGWRVNN